MLTVTLLVTNDFPCQFEIKREMWLRKSSHAAGLRGHCELQQKALLDAGGSALNWNESTGEIFKVKCPVSRSLKSHVIYLHKSIISLYIAIFALFLEYIAHHD